jgi:bacterioferritin (cytochrome b1)
MFGWRLTRESELAVTEQLHEARLEALRAELYAAKQYAAKAENLLDHERERIDAERERADRMADSIFQSNGLPAVSPVVLAEERQATAATERNIAEYRKQVEEIFGETLDDIGETDAEDILKEAAEAVKS